MKTIKKIKESSKAVAGSALLVGATLAGGAAFATASSHNMGGSSGSGDASLGDYPGHFIGEDGTVSSTVVMGEDANAVDVVAGSAIAGQLGNNAFSTQTETVETSGSGVGGGFSATNGVTLDTANDDLFYGDTLDSIRDTLTQDNLDVLSETTFTDDSGDDTDVTNFLNIGNQPVQFGNGPDGIDDDEDPVLHVPVPAEGDVNDEADNGVDNYLFNLQANFEDGLDMTSEDVAGEDIELFGTTFTIAEENNVDSVRNELVLYGSSETVSASTGESTTVTINGEEATLEVVGVTASDRAAVRVNGDLEQLDEDEEVTVNGQDIRADNVIQTNSDNSQGTVQFSIGSQELVLQDGEQIEDGDGDDVEGTYVVFNGDGDDQFDFDSEEVSSIDLYVGAQDDDNDYVAAGETFTHDFLDQVEFQFAGLNPDAADSEGTTEVSVETNGDTEAQISFTADSGNSVSQDFLHVQDSDTSSLDSSFSSNGDDINLADSDNDEIVVREGATVEEDEYFTADAGDFAHMYEVTGIDRDATGDLEQGDEAFIDLRDVTTGNTREVDIDAVSTDGDVTEDGSSDGEFYAGTEIIDGQSYKFVVSGDDEEADGSSDVDTIDGDSEPEFRFAYGDGSKIEVSEGINTGLYTGGVRMDSGAVSLFTAVDTENNGAVSFAEETEVVTDHESSEDTEAVLTFELPSTQSTDAKTVDVAVTGVDTGSNDDAEEYDVDINNDGETDFTADGDTEFDEFRVGQTVYTFEASSFTSSSDGDSSNATVSFSLGVADDQSSVASSGTGGANAENPAALFFQPEDDDDNENAFVLTPNGYDSDDGFSFSGSDAREYTGTIDAGLALEGTDDDTNAGYNEYGTYVETDTEDEGSVSLHVPNGQATAGAAFTGADGEISMTGGGGSGTYEALTPTGFSNQYTALDSDSSVSSAKQNRHLVLVGGPAVNSVVGELVEANETMAGSEYTEGQGMLQLVEDAFSEGHDALIVAGFSGEDTRAAGEFLVNHDENSDALEGSTQVTVNTAEGTVVQ